MRLNSKILVIVFLFSLCFTLNTQAQNITGEISGVVKDATGSVVPGVDVTATNTGTNALYTAVSNDIGVFTLRALPIGTYNLNAELAGFKRFEATNIAVQVNEISRVNVTLEIGEVTETIQVAADVINVDTQTSSLKTVIDQRRVEDLPLNGRDPVQLMRLVAGVSKYDGAGLTSGTTYPGVVNVSVNGARGNATNFVLDGGQNNDHYSNAPNPMPNPDALAEFSVQTNNFSAEFGRNSGGLVNAVTKSGTNQFHGTAFGYVRNAALNAANFFAPIDANGEKVDDGLKRSQFGATAGGPVWLGGLYDGRDKSFWFFSYQGTRIRQTPTTRFVTVFTEAERNGDFSSVSKQLVSPFTGQPYTNNQIPQSDWSPISKYILDNLIPLPPAGTNQISYATLSNADDDQFLVKGDHNISDNNVASGRFYRSFASQPGFLDQKNVYNSVTQREWLNWSVAVNDTHTFGPSLINQALFSFNKTEGPSIQIYPEKNLKDLGINVSQDDAPQYVFEVQGVSGINTGDTNNFIRDEWQVSDTVRWTTGMHQLSVGGEWGTGLGDIVNNYYGNGRMYFRDSANFTGDAQADFLVGKMAEWRQGIGEFKNTRFDRVSFFIHDSMKVSSRLTLDLGLRWEPFLPYTDSLGKLSVWMPGEQSVRYPNAPTNVLYPGDPQLPNDGGVPRVWSNFGPRLGFAYDLTGDGKTSLRAGYGVFYDQSNTISTNSQANQGPFGTRVYAYGNEFNSMAEPWAGPPFYGENPLPIVGFNAVGTDVLNPGPDATFILPHVAFVYAPDMRNAQNQAWNLTLEREVMGNTVLRASYAGSRGNRLVSGRDINAPLPCATCTTGTTAERRPMYPNFERVTLIEPVGKSYYHALQLTAERRFTDGLSIMTNYTWSKVIDNNQGSANKATGTSVTNPLDQSFDRGLADYDKTHVFNFSSLWEMPFQFESGVAQAILGGWNLTSIISLYSGVPFTVGSGVDNARTGQGGQRADLVGDPDPGSQSRGEAIEEYLNKDAFATNALGTYGTLGRNTFRGPGYANVDLGIHKRFYVTEETRIEFRFEMFNAFNRVNLGNPTTGMTSSNFMKITSADDPRILQFALRFEW